MEQEVDTIHARPQESYVCFCKQVEQRQRSESGQAGRADTSLRKHSSRGQGKMGQVISHFLSGIECARPIVLLEYSRISLNFIISILSLSTDLALEELNRRKTPL